MSIPKLFLPELPIIGQDVDIFNANMLAFNEAVQDQVGGSVYDTGTTTVSLPSQMQITGNAVEQYVANDLGGLAGDASGHLGAAETARGDASIAASQASAHEAAALAARNDVQSFIDTPATAVLSGTPGVALTWTGTAWRTA